MKRWALIFFLLISINLIGQNKVNSNLFGFRTSSAFVLFDTSDSTFINLVKKINPEVLSFPGGLGNFFHLNGPGYGLDVSEVEQNHTGSKPKVANTFTRITKKKKHLDNYIFDFINLVEITNSKVIYNANILTAEVNEILEILDIFYNNDIELIGVELGGELTNRTYKHVINEAKYINKTKKIARAIKEKYPKLKLIVVAAPISGLKRHEKWNNELSKEDFYDGIFTHSYAKVTKGKDEFGRMISEENEGKDKREAFNIYKTRALRYFAKDYPEEINKFNTIFNDKEIWVTEWNLQMSKITANTMLQGLFVASYLLEINSNQKLQNITLTTFHNLAGRTLSGSMILNKDDKVTTLLSYSVMKLISNIFDNTELFLNKSTISNECYRYSFFNENNLLKQVIINWSDESIAINEERQIATASEIFSENLYSTHDSIDLYTYSDFSGVFSVKPFSITLISYE